MSAATRLPVSGAKTRHILGKAPVAKTPLCFTPVDFAANALVALSLRDDGARQTYHIVGDMGVTLEDVLAVAEGIGHDVERVRTEDWIGQLTQRLDKKSLEPVAPYLVAYPALALKGILDPMAFPAISTAFTDRRLEEEAIAKTTASRVLIAKYLDYLTGIGFLEAPLHTERSGQVYGLERGRAGE